MRTYQKNDQIISNKKLLQANYPSRYKLVVIMMLIMITLSAMMAIPAKATAATNNFEISNGVLVKYLGKSINVVVPNTVTKIGDDAFFNQKKIQSVKLPNSITGIGNQAFAFCSGLKKINIPDKVTYIGDSAFTDCSSLKSITLPNKISSLGTGVFTRCKGLTRIIIPNSVTSIAKGAFSECSNLVNITLPNKITTISESTFSDCTHLEKVLIPRTVTSIEDYAFSRCSYLKNITFSKAITSIGKYAFYGCSSLKAIIIPEAATSIGDCAFKDCSSLSSIKLPATVTQIASDAFSNTSWYKALVKNNPLVIINNILIDASKCTGVVTVPKGVIKIEANAFRHSHVTEIIVPEGVTKIGEAAFATTALKKITLPDSITEIGPSAFSESHLTSIKLPAGITSINDFTFFRCQRLKSIDIPDGVTSLGFKSFAFCSNLTKITLPKSLASLGRNAFYQDYLLSNIQVDQESPYYVAEGRFIFNPDKTELLLYNTKLSEEVIIPEGVEKIAEKVFYDCKEAKVTLPSTLKSLGNNVFYSCSELTEINLPSSLMDYGEQMLEFCPKLSSLNVYEANNQIDFTSDNGILYNADKTMLICNPNSGDIMVPDGVTSIGSYAFPNVSKSVVIPKSVTAFGDAIFNYEMLWRPADQPQFYVYGYVGSAAEKYCEDHDINFLAYDKTYTISYVLNGGINHSKNPTTYNYQSATIELQNPTRAGYKFLYWYKDISICEDGCCRGELKMNSIPEKSLGDIELIAKWEKATTNKIK